MSEDWVETYHKKKREEQAEKGGPGSGHWGHAGRPGKRGGSLPGDVAVSIHTGRTARLRQAEAAGTLVPPGQFQTIDQAQLWFQSQNLEADFTGITNVEAVNEIAGEVERLQGEFGWAFEAHLVIADTGSFRKRLDKTRDWRFLGIQTYESPNCPGKIPELGGDAAAITEDRLTLFRHAHGGPLIYWNPDTVNRNEESIYAMIGLTAAPSKNLAGITAHEFGHVIWSKAAATPDYPYTMNPDEPAYMRFGEKFGHAMNRVGITHRMLKRNVSWYATTNDKEAFAEIFSVMQHPEGQKMSKAFRKRLDKLAAELKKETGLEVLKWSSQ